jgi:hypothetical protein
MRLELIEHGRPLLETVVEAILGVKVTSLHKDTGAVITFTPETEVGRTKRPERERPRLA